MSQACADRAVTAWLIASGYSSDGQWPLKMAVKDGQRILVAGESKRAAVEYPHDSGVFKHGLDDDRLQKYRDTAEAAGIPLILTIHESQTGVLLAENMDSLPPGELKRGGRDGNSLLNYWLRSDFRQVWHETH